MCRQDHDRAVARLRAALSSLPEDAPIRLGKPSSNLFRFGSRDRAPGLPVSGLDTVIRLDRDARTVEVGGLITYEKLVAATLPEKLMPAVVPQLKTITLGGAVAGLGIESTSFRNGLPHESVVEMDVLTGSGELVTVTAEDALFRAFPNSYGTLGYAVRLVIRLVEVENNVELSHHRFASPVEAFTAMDELWTHQRVHFLDGVCFDRGEIYLTAGRFDDRPGPTSDYTGQSVYYRSIRERDTDRLTIHDYLWRWDTDWFWCSAAFGVQNRLVRPLWPRQYRRSDVYRRLVGLDRRIGVTRRLGAMLGSRREAVIQDVEIPMAQAAQFLERFLDAVPIRPVWLCPLRSADDRSWPLYRLDPDTRYVNFGFWATVPLESEMSTEHYNRLVEELVAECGGHKSLYSTVHYDRAQFWRSYDEEAYRQVKERYDPAGRLPELYNKVVGDHATR